MLALFISSILLASPASCVGWARRFVSRHFSYFIFSSTRCRLVEVENSLTTVELKASVSSLNSST